MTVWSLSVKRGEAVTLEHYRVLGLFSKNANKWFVCWDADEVALGTNGKSMKVMVRMMQKGDGDSTFGEVDLVSGGEWGPKFVYPMKFLNDVVKVEAQVESISNVWGEE